MWPFRPPRTPSDGPGRHQLTLDLIERVADLQGQIGALRTEWDAAKDTLQKGWQRLEKANQRAERRLQDGDGGNSLPDSGDDHALAEPSVPLFGFAKKLADIRGK